MTDQSKLSALERYRREAQLLKDMQESLKLEGYEHKDGGWILSYDDMTSIAVRIADLKSGKERLDAELSTERSLTSQYREMAEERLRQVKRLEKRMRQAREHVSRAGSSTKFERENMIQALSLLEAGKPKEEEDATN